MNWEGRVSQWAADRGLLTDSTPSQQIGKLVEELEELILGINNDDDLEIGDAIGDCCVVLCIIASQRGLRFSACLEHAWNEIKDRKGKMVDGVFVKESP